MNAPILSTQRLRLEPFDDTHLDGLYRLNSDPEVMRYITGMPQSREETQAMIERVKRAWADWGCSWWCFIEIETNEIIGAGCIQYLGRDPANPHEIGWRLRKDKWHQGFASEAARCMAAFAFETLQAQELIAVCHPENAASELVMKKLGMTYRGIERWYDLDLPAYHMAKEHF
ncbi:RimJ/RimL family protein N-acetyltransferase [Oxalobacteraceae bacterium GrIS 2.11]